VGDDMWIWHCYPVGSSIHSTPGMCSIGQVALLLRMFVRPMFVCLHDWYCNLYVRNLLS